MKGQTWGRLAAAALCGVAVGWIPQAGARMVRQQTASEAAPVTIALPARPPKGAVVLFSGKQEDMSDNWYSRRTKDAAGWTVSDDGVATPNKKDVTSKQEFGDCYLHVEFRCPADAAGNPLGGGNSGVGMQGRYEIQILNSYGQKPEEHQCGSFYSQKAPIVIASKKPGAWQTYDIIFRAPRFDDSGQMKEKARATVFQNHILIQNNEEFPGPTGIQYEDNKGEVKTGPIVLQGDHDPVQYRNVWVAPL